MEKHTLSLPGKWRRPSSLQWVPEGVAREETVPFLLPVSDGLGKECVGTDLERESETRLKVAVEREKDGAEASETWTGP